MNPWIDGILEGLPAGEAEGLRKAAASGLPDLVRLLAAGPEERFAALLARVPPAELAEAAATLLAAGDEPPAARLLDLPALRPFLEKLVPRVPKGALAVLLPRLARAADPESVGRAAAVLSGLPLAGAVRDAVRNLAWTGERALFPLFQGLLEGKNAAYRHAGLDGIARGAGPGDVPLLLEAVRREIAAQQARPDRNVFDSVPQDEYFGGALARLHELGAPPDGALIREVLALPTHKAAQQAVEVLNRFERRDLLDILVETLRHKGEHLRLLALRVVARLGGAEERLRLLERFLTSIASNMGPFFAEAFADNGIVDAIPLLEPYRIRNPVAFSPYGTAIARLEFTRFTHGLASRDHVRGRLAQFEAEIDACREEPGRKWMASERGPVLLKLHLALGDPDAFLDLLDRLRRVHGIRDFDLARKVPHPAFLPALRSQPPAAGRTEAELLALRFRCGEAEALGPLEAALTGGTDLSTWKITYVRHFPEARRAGLWRPLYAGIEPSWRGWVIDNLPECDPTEEFRPLLRSIAADPGEVRSVRIRAAWQAERPFPVAPAAPPLIRLPEAAVARLRRKAEAAAEKG